MKNILILALFLIVFTPAYGQDNLPVVQEKNGMYYVSGGVGAEEREALKSREGDYNLKVSSIVPGGEYTGPFALEIKDAKGKSLIKITTGGPVFYAYLPVGQYQVDGKFEGQEKTLFATVSVNRLKTVNFSWKE